MRESNIVFALVLILLTPSPLQQERGLLVNLMTLRVTPLSLTQVLQGIPILV
jgi:hypothetical protein